MISMRKDSEKLLKGFAVRHSTAAAVSRLYSAAASVFQIGSWLAQTILVEKQPHISPVPLHCHKAFPLTLPMGCAGFGSQKATQGVGAGGHVHLMSQRSPGTHRCLPAGWCYSLFCLQALGLWTSDVPTRAPASALPLIKSKDRNKA